MRITARRGDHEVTIELEGATPQLLRQAERTALQLLGEPDQKADKPAFGFQGTTEQENS